MSFFIGCNSKTTYFNTPVKLAEYDVSVVDAHVSPQAFHFGHTYYIKVIEHSEESDTNLVADQLHVELAYPCSVLCVVKAVADAIGGYASVELDQKGKLEVTCNEKFSLLFPTSLSRILGFQFTLFVGQNKASFCVDPEQYAERIVVVCNLVESNQVNGQFLPIVYFGPLSYHSDSPLYRKTVVKESSSITIQMFNAMLEPLNIPNHAFSLLLHFRKRS